MGYRFRVHVPDLPGTPDIVLPRWKTAIFVHGCFWHRHAKCRFAYTPKTRLDFWSNKFNENVRLDAASEKQLRRAGWKVIIIWECQTRKIEQLKHRLFSRLQQETC
jgi:DNA mismatch endonuclease (patch repair protein)